MTDRFYPTDISTLLGMLLRQFEQKKEFFGIPFELAFRVIKTSNKLSKDFWGKPLHTPVGLAAGPHTQLAQNIIAGWHCGARYMELKTVQVLDELEITRPCINMFDMGFNCEWSQELKIRQSLHEYVKAWVIIHLLNNKLFNSYSDSYLEPGVQFNASVGYNLEGIKSHPVNNFLNEIRDVSGLISEFKAEIINQYPEFKKVNIPGTMVDTITLSTMHGCPPDEIEAIGKYLLEEKNFNLLIKLNPTLLGKEKVREILHHNLNFQIEVPDIAFDHDPKFADAVKIIQNLKKTADRKGLKFGIKLSNTLETTNNRKVLPESEKMVYMSGRPLLPITVNLALELQKAFDGDLEISYSGGADCFNMDKLIGCGFFPVTVCSDLLKPGGYGRLAQYIETIEHGLKMQNAGSIDDFICESAGENKNLKEARMQNLERLAHEVLFSDHYRRTYIHPPDIKGPKPLGLFDCNHAPCTDSCATRQEIPEYLYWAASGQFEKSLNVIRKDNPLPSITGTICDHKCQYSCIRAHYDEPVRIRDVKRSVVHQVSGYTPNSSLISGGFKVAIVGAGPGGLSCGHYLAKNGVRVDIFDIRNEPGGMVSYSLPGYRIGKEDINLDIQHLSEKINFHHGQRIDRESFSSLLSGYDFVVLAAGAWKPRELNIPGNRLEGVVDPVSLLHLVNTGTKPMLGKTAVIIGGGNTAMDAARTSKRLLGNEGEVILVYRRTITEMPADEGEIRAALSEGIKIIEKAAPVQCLGIDGKISAIQLVNTRTMDNPSGKRADFKIIEGSEFEIRCDTVIPALGHISNTELLDTLEIQVIDGCIQSSNPRVFVIGDALRGASTAINAIADGKNTAFDILQRLNINKKTDESVIPSGKHDYRELKMKKYQRVYPQTETETGNIPDTAPQPLSAEACMQEAGRCLQCDNMCGNCTTVCPNLANVLIVTNPLEAPVYSVIRTGSGYKIISTDTISIRQEYQILNIGNWCNECGNCNTFCPTADAPYKVKPRLHLCKESFDNDNRGYFIDKQEYTTIYFKSGENTGKMVAGKDSLLFSQDNAMLNIHPEDFSIQDYHIDNELIKDINTKEAVIMKYILDAALMNGLI